MKTRILNEVTKARKRLALPTQRCSACDSQARPARIGHYPGGGAPAIAFHYRCETCQHESPAAATNDLACALWDAEWHNHIANYIQAANEAEGVVIPPAEAKVFTDRDQFTAMLNHRKIAFTEEVCADSVEDIIVGRGNPPVTRGKAIPGKISIIIEGGYTGFFTVIEFDLSGKLLTIGAFE